MTAISVIDQVIPISEKIIASLDVHAVRLPQVKSQYNIPWSDAMWISDNFRRAHLHVVDARESLNLWILHCTIFPDINDPGPIFGLDIIAGPNRISGVFHDYSVGADPDHYMMRWFKDQSRMLSWKKPRELPDWGKQIFSESMISVGAVNSPAEINQMAAFFDMTLEHYLEYVGQSKQLGKDYTQQQNRYCEYQRQNPHTPRVMKMLGLSEEEANWYFNEVMFPYISFET